jgi:3-oxoacyl-[acyl-carrier protein] reductase
MDLGLAGRVAIVAAASKGLGRAAAEALAQEGAQTAICARTARDLEATAGAIEQETGRKVFWRVVDVTEPAAVERFIAEVDGAFGRIDICVTNAGGPPAKTFLEISPEDWRAAVEAMLLSAVSFARGVLPRMQRQRWGRFITITSITVKQPLENLMLSNAVRAAVTGLAKTLANEFGPYGITVNNVCPGHTLTQRVEELAAMQGRAAGLSADAVKQKWASEVPLRRLGRPEEFAAVVAFLASERASYINGASIAIDGGRVECLL